VRSEQRNKLLVELAVASAVQAVPTPSHFVRRPRPFPLLPFGTHVLSPVDRQPPDFPSDPGSRSGLSLSSSRRLFCPGEVCVWFGTGSWSVLTRFLFCPFFSVLGWVWVQLKTFSARKGSWAGMSSLSCLWQKEGDKAHFFVLTPSTVVSLPRTASGASLHFQTSPLTFFVAGFYVYSWLSSSLLFP
jgi:hypothetical protein